MKRVLPAVALAVLCLVCLVMLPGCEGGRRVVLQPGDDGRVVSVNAGDRVEIRLPGNPSTGYTWRRVEPGDGELWECPLQVIREGGMDDR